MNRCLTTDAKVKGWHSSANNTEGILKPFMKLSTFKHPSCLALLRTVVLKLWPWTGNISIPGEVARNANF